MALGSWFDADYFAQQKLIQMAALQLPQPMGDTPVAQLQNAIAAWNKDHPDQQTTLEENFVNCNTQGYVPQVPRQDINVSPNPLFDIPYYLTALAAHANATGYKTAAVAPGAWTAQNMLQHLYEQHTSAWAHYKGSGLDERIDCSAAFATGPYIAAKAQATGQSEEAVTAQMKAEGLNPLMDYFEHGQALGLKPIAAAHPLTVTMQNGQQWAA